MSWRTFFFVPFAFGRSTKTYEPYNILRAVPINRRSPTFVSAFRLFRRHGDRPFRFVSVFRRRSTTGRNVLSHAAVARAVGQPPRRVRIMIANRRRFIIEHTVVFVKRVSFQREASERGVVRPFIEFRSYRGENVTLYIYKYITGFYPVRNWPSEAYATKRRIKFTSKYGSASRSSGFVRHRDDFIRTVYGRAEEMRTRRSRRNLLPLRTARPICRRFVTDFDAEPRPTVAPSRSNSVPISPPSKRSPTRR